MHTQSADYVHEEISDALMILEQMIGYEKNVTCQIALTRSIAVMRALKGVGRGTRWLSELSSQ